MTRYRKEAVKLMTDVQTGGWPSVYTGLRRRRVTVPPPPASLREEALKLTNVLLYFHSAVCKYVRRGVGSRNNATANTDGSDIEERRKSFGMELGSGEVRGLCPQVASFWWQINSANVHQQRRNLLGSCCFASFNFTAG